MAVDKKISQLTSLAQVDVDAALDVLPIVDTSAVETKKITVSALVGAGASAGLTSVDINSGTIDGTSIGASSASTGAFTTLTTSSTVTLNGGTANGVLYLNGSKVATSGSALTFDGTNFATTGTSSAAKLIPTGGTASGNGIYLPAANSIGITTSSTNAIRINASQQTGFGNTAPAYRVHATQTSDGAATTVACLENGGTLASTEARMLFVQGGNTTRGAYVGGLNESASGQPTSMVFGTSAAFATPTERMRLDSSGNLGIGTTSPANKLDVVGGISATKNQSSLNLISSSGQSGFATITNSGGVTYVGVEGTGGGASFSGASANASIIGSGTTNPLQFVTNTTVRATLDSSGNLGLGVTPSAWSSSYKALQVGATASMFGGASGEAAYIQSNAFLSATGYKYITTAAATQYGQSGGAHSWSTAASGTAGNAITFTQAMTLDASGRLLLGTTSASSVSAASGSYLQVVGNSSGNAGLLSLSRSVTAVDTAVLGQIVFADNVGQFAEIRAQCTGTPGTNDYPGSLMFYTTPDNSATCTERARITAAGELLVGLTSATSGGGVLQISNGITFPATQSASSNANTLDDYEEGTYTATLTPGTSGSITVNSSFNTLNYTKIGRVVYVNGYITASSISSPVGSLTLNLPFTTANTTQRSAWGAGVINIAGSASSVANGFGIIFNNNVATATIVIATGANNADAAAQIQGASNTDIRISFWFITS